jgi:hypothetical protein
MHRPPMYPQLPHLYNHGLAILACITPFWNMRPPPVYPELWSYHFIWKEIFEEVIFLLKYHQNPQEIEHRKKKKIEKTYWKRKKRRGRKRKALRVFSNKGEVNILIGEKYSNFKIFFLLWFHFLPLHHTISKTPSKIIKKVFLTLFRPSFTLAIHITWVVPFLFTHEL